MPTICHVRLIHRRTYCLLSGRNRKHSSGLRPHSAECLPNPKANWRHLLVHCFRLGSGEVLRLFLRRKDMLPVWSLAHHSHCRERSLYLPPLLAEAEPPKRLQSRFIVLIPHGAGEDGEGQEGMGSKEKETLPSSCQ